MRTSRTSSIRAPLRIATRGSRLALVQSEMVAQLVRGARPDVDVELVTISTRGDRDQRPFTEIGGKGLFTNEVERAVMEGAADVAVHSAKDLTAEIAPGCALVCVPSRAPVEDVVVGGEGSSGEERLGSLPPGARVGTSSLRRRSLLAEARPDLDVVDLRGNLDTRLAKVERGEVDVAVLAAAGLERLGLLQEVGGAVLASDWWVPAPAQGAIAVEALIEREDITELFRGLGDDVTRAEISCERSFSGRLEGSCSVPLGCSARWAEGRLVVNGFLGLPDGSYNIRDRISGPLGDAVSLGTELAEAIAQGGGEDILEQLREE